MNTISDIQNTIDIISNFDPMLKNHWNRAIINDYDDFLKCFYSDLDQIIDIIQENRELRQDDSEDRLTIEIVGHLKQLSYNASHDPKVGGHVDIFVQKKKNALSGWEKQKFIMALLIFGKDFNNFVRDIQLAM